MSKIKINVGEARVPNELIALARSLPNPSQFKNGDEITICFGREYIYLSTLTLLATWRKSLAAGISVTVDDRGALHATQNMITNSGFREIIDTGHESPSVQRRHGKLPLRPITNRLNKDSVVQDITSILTDNTALIGDVKPLTTILSEICENALTHSGFASPGYVQANVTENERRKIEIAICDSGMGFRDSYLSGTNAEIKTRIERGANPIEIAIEGLNSSKPIASSGSVVSYYGFGLYITRRLVEENRGQLFILSHKDAMYLSNRERKNFDLDYSFPGTLLVIILDLDNPLPLEEIYTQAVEKYQGPDVHTTDKTNSSQLRSLPSNKTEEPKKPDELIDSAEIQLRHYGTELLTRETGLAIRADIATQALARRSIIIDLDGISDITPSVADEAFAKLAEKIGADNFNRIVTFRGGSSLVNRLIEFVMKTRLN